MTLSEKQKQLCEAHDFDFSGLSALFLNCTLKPTPEKSHTEALIEVSRAIMEKSGISTDYLRPVDYRIAPGVYPDMTEHGFDADDWPELAKQILAADILVIGSPIWLGHKSSVCTRVVERLYSRQGSSMTAGSTSTTGEWADA